MGCSKNNPCCLLALINCHHLPLVMCVKADPPRFWGSLMEVLDGARLNLLLARIRHIQQQFVHPNRGAAPPQQMVAANLAVCLAPTSSPSLGKICGLKQPKIVPTQLMDSALCPHRAAKRPPANPDVPRLALSASPRPGQRGPSLQDPYFGRAPSVWESGARGQYPNHADLVWRVWFAKIAGPDKQSASVSSKQYSKQKFGR